MLKKRLFHLSLFLGCLLILTGIVVSQQTEEASAQTNPFPQPPWVVYINLWRDKAGLPEVEQLLSLTQASYDHSVYMLETGHLAHYERPESEWYTDEGNQSAFRSNLAASNTEFSDYVFAIDYWVASPFNLIAMLDPKLEFVGYGNAWRPGTINNPIPPSDEDGDGVDDSEQLIEDENDDGTDSREQIEALRSNLVMAANLDVWNGRMEEVPEGVTYPIMFPPDGGVTWIIRHSQFEYPNPFSFCTEYENPSGPGIVILLGDGSNVPVLQDHYFAVVNADGTEETLDYCIFDETTYTSPLFYEEDDGLQILDERDAVVIMPKDPLELDHTYVASVRANGETHAWSFSTVRPPEDLRETLEGN